MKILAIGNSFSQDATRYLAKVARGAKESIKVVNLYIPGCPLDTHYRNMLSEKPAYSMEFGGETTGFFVSLKEALLSDSWDVVTIQQASGKSPNYSTYQPYATALVDYVRLHVPKAKVLVHMTWAYEEGSDRLANLGFAHFEDMSKEVFASYRKLAEDVQADGIIPSGEVLLGLYRAGISEIHRDTFHASLGVGRYALALTWFAVIYGKRVGELESFALDVPCEEQILCTARRIVDKTVFG